MFTSLVVFLLLLAVMILISGSVSLLVAKTFRNAIGLLLSRIVGEEIAVAWSRYFHFAILVVGLGGGVNIYQLEQYLKVATDDFMPPILTAERWILEVVRATLDSLESIAWMLLIFFIFSMIALVVAKLVNALGSGKDLPKSS